MSSALQRASCAIVIAAAFCAACSGRPDRSQPAVPSAPAQVGAPQPERPADAADVPPEPEPAIAIETPASPGDRAPAERRRAPPSIPLGVTATALGETRVELRWEPSKTEEGSGEIVYEVLRDGQPTVEAKEPRAEEIGLSAATEYCYAVRARDAAGRRSKPAAKACATTPDLTPPSAPSSVVAKASTDHVVEVRWAAATDNVGVAAYEVMRGGDVVSVAVTTAGEALGLSPAKEYCYTVRAVDAAGNASEPAGPACATTPDLQPPSPPPFAEAVAGGETNIAVRWSAATDDVGVVRYEVTRAAKRVANVPRLAAVEAGLEPWTEYCYVVRAVDAAGNTSAPAGPLCARTMDTTSPTRPANLVAVASSESRVDVSWQASTDNSPGGVVGYEVRRGEKVVASTTHEEAGETDLRPFTEHCYTVVALDGAGNRSAVAGPACARTLDVTPPTAPASLALYPASDSLLEARWRPSTDNHGVAGYELVRGDRVVASNAGPSAREPKLAPTTEYCYRVRAYDAAGNRSGEAGPICMKTLATGQPPPPRNVAFQRTPSAVLKWDAPPSPGLVYRVYEDGRRVGATRFPSYSLASKLDKRRCYTVTSLDTAGRESPRSEEACLAPLLGETASR